MQSMCNTYVDAYVVHMENENVNVNVNVNENVTDTKTINKK